MATLLSQDLVRYVPRSESTWRDPFTMYAALREHDPVHHVEAGDYWVLTRHRDVFGAVRDHETFSSAHGHTTAYDELERLVADGGGDIVAALFKPLPSMVVAHYLGVPEADRDRFDAWTDAIVAANATATHGDVGGAIGELTYFTELVERRRTEPGDDTVSHLVAAGEAGDDEGLLRILAFTFTMVTGGNDTTTGMLGGAVQLLSERPDQRRIAGRDPDSTVEEMLRLTSPVQGLARTTTRDVTIGGRTIPAGGKVLLSYGAANRDPDQYGPDADELDVTRNPRRILTFAQGAHHCLGAAAARMMGRVTLSELLARVPDFSVDLDAVRWAAGSYVRRPTTVPPEVL